MFKKILIANRGEIACRVMRTCEQLGIATVAVYSDADRRALHVKTADEAVAIGPAEASRSYLDIDRILAAARQTGAEAIHPGYGFLSENSEFARRCAAAGIVFIGPAPESMDAMASKSAAKALMEKAGVPVTPGYHGDDQSLEKLETEAQKIGFPMMIKATAGGGGKGMRVVHKAGEFRDALESAQRESKGAFGDDKVLLEKFVERPRHIEFQVFGDTHGNAVHVFERECTLQRRFQKVVEETPSPFLDAATRAEMGEAAVAAAKAVDYVNAGTVEFIVGADKSFHFMEMNTRLQVEHPITEEVTGLDLVEWQLRIADGEKIPLTQEAIRQQGHAIEARLYAENTDKGFLPVTGHIDRFDWPFDEVTRVDTGVQDGDDISIFYDPMIAKISVRGEDRAEAIGNLRAALAQTAVFGLVTNLPLLRGIARHPGFAEGEFDTGFIEHELTTLLERSALTPAAMAAALAERVLGFGLEGYAPHPWDVDGWRLDGSRGRRLLLTERDGTEHAIHIEGDEYKFHFTSQEATSTVRDVIDLDIANEAYQGFRMAGRWYSPTVLRYADQYQVALDDEVFEFRLASPFSPRAAAVADTATQPVSPMPGRVVAVHVKEGDAIEVGQPLMVLEGMKMEYTVKAGVAGTLDEVLYGEGDMVDAEAPLVRIQAGE